jgi:hypothetical protein
LATIEGATSGVGTKRTRSLRLAMSVHRYLNNNNYSLQWLDRRRGGSRGGGGRPRWGGRLRNCLIFGRRPIGHRLTVACRDTSVRACGSPCLPGGARSSRAPGTRNRWSSSITYQRASHGTDRPEHHCARYRPKRGVGCTFLGHRCGRYQRKRDRHTGDCLFHASSPRFAAQSKSNPGGSPG